MNLTEGRGPGLVLVRRAGNFLSWTTFNNSTVITRPIVVQICLKEWWLRWTGVGARAVIVDNLCMRARHKNVVLRFGGFSCFGSPRPLLPSKISLCEALFAGLLFPVVVADTSSILDYPATELTEHRSRGHDCYLPRSIREREDFLLDKVVLFSLAGNDLVERPVFVEQEV